MNDEMCKERIEKHRFSKRKLSSFNCVDFISFSRKIMKRGYLIRSLHGVKYSRLISKLFLQFT